MTGKLYLRELTATYWDCTFHFTNVVFLMDTNPPNLAQPLCATRSLVPQATVPGEAVENLSKIYIKQCVKKLLQGFAFVSLFSLSQMLYLFCGISLRA